MDAKQTRLGIILALAAYIIWGIAPASFKLIYYVPPMEILTHRVIWSSLLHGGAHQRQPPVATGEKAGWKTPRARSSAGARQCWSAVTGCCSSGR
ncbi:hypothetical protein LN650_00325 [Klebsiella pneumoniae subsp. pneumoniae]|nr:hypothetical protein [Klebsiella pneumoniae subsp. pneumoniae]